MQLELFEKSVSSGAKKFLAETNNFRHRSRGRLKYKNASIHEKINWRTYFDNYMIRFQSWDNRYVWSNKLILKYIFYPHKMKY